MINLEDVIAALYDGTIDLEDIEEAYLNHNLSNDDIDVIIESLNDLEPIDEISADLAKKAYIERLHRAGANIYHVNQKDYDHNNLKAIQNYERMQKKSGLFARMMNKMLNSSRMNKYMRKGYNTERDKWDDFDKKHFYLKINPKK